MKPGDLRVWDKIPWSDEDWNSTHAGRPLVLVREYEAAWGIRAWVCLFEGALHEFNGDLVRTRSSPARATGP